MNNKNNNNDRALQQLKENRLWYLILGIGMVILGTFALIYANFTTVISIIFLGCILLVSGVFEIIKSIKVNKLSSLFLHLFLGILFIIGGISFIANPTMNALMLTLLFAILFVISGISKIAFATVPNVIHRNWILFNGIITLLLGILIWLQWPYSGLWILGTFMGIDMIITGITWIHLSMVAQQMSTTNK